jgi:hypothetical protein
MTVFCIQDDRSRVPGLRSTLSLTCPDKSETLAAAAVSAGDVGRQVALVGSLQSVTKIWLRDPSAAAALSPTAVLRC